MPVRATKDLTDLQIRKAKATIKQYEIFDRSVGGFALRVSPSGLKNFVVNVRVNKKATRMTIGKAGAISLTDARAAAIKIKNQVKAGMDPREKVRCEKEERQIAAQGRNQNTFASISDLFIQRYCIEDKKLRSWREYKRILHKYVFPHWENRDIADINRADITKLLDNIANNHGPYQANRALATIRKLFNWACVRGTIQFIPIFTGIARSEKPRERVLANEEIVKFWQTCERIGYPFGHLFKLCLLTGQRRVEIAGMKWSQINIIKKVWKLPSHATKMKREHLVPLNTMAVELIELMPRYADKDLLFATQWSNDRPVSGFTNAKKRFSDIKDWQLHDLRRTVRTSLGQLKIPYVICNKVLGYYDRNVEKHYDVYEYIDEKRDALEKWSDRLTSILSENVVVLDTKRA